MKMRYPRKSVGSVPSVMVYAALAISSIHRSNLTNVLREVPVMPFRIRGAVAAVAVEHILGFLKDHSARLPGLFIMLVHIANIDVQALRHTAEPLRILIIRTGASHHDD